MNYDPAEILAAQEHFGFARPALIQQILARFSDTNRETLSVLDYAHVRMADGLVATSEEDYARAIRDFETVLALEDAIQDKQVMSIANYWIGRCLRRQGRYDDALGYVAKAKGLASRLRYPKMAAVMQVLEGCARKPNSTRLTTVFLSYLRTGRTGTGR